VLPIIPVYAVTHHPGCAILLTTNVGVCVYRLQGALDIQ
jgi:hypothetical protein